MDLQNIKAGVKSLIAKGKTQEAIDFAIKQFKGKNKELEQKLYLLSNQNSKLEETERLNLGKDAEAENRITVALLDLISKADAAIVPPAAVDIFAQKKKLVIMIGAILGILALIVLFKPLLINDASSEKTTENISTKKKENNPAKNAAENVNTGMTAAEAKAKKAKEYKADTEKLITKYFMFSKPLTESTRENAVAAELEAYKKGVALFEQGRYRDAIGLLENLIQQESNPSNNTFYVLGCSQLYAKDYNGAKESFQRIMKNGRRYSHIDNVEWSMLLTYLGLNQFDNSFQTLLYDIESDTAHKLNEFAKSLKADIKNSTLNELWN